MSQERIDITKERERYKTLCLRLTHEVDQAIDETAITALTTVMYRRARTAGLNHATFMAQLPEIFEYTRQKYELETQ